MSETPLPPTDVSVDVFRQWRDARRGVLPADDLSNPYWSWLVSSEASSWSANEYFKGPSSCGGNPAWSAERFGQSTTNLLDGRTLKVAGEHEDHYDPDFFIYNDVIEISPDRTIRILGFPTQHFPPTDFHSATLWDGKLLLIGNLGYPDQRIEGETQILVLDPETWEIRRQPSSGDGPGWIHGHQATLEEDGSIRLNGGKVWKSGGAGLVENFDEWRLNPNGWTWERLTRREVTVMEFRRTDGKPNQLFEMGIWIFNQNYKLPDMQEVFGFTGLDIDPETLAKMNESMKGLAPLDHTAYEKRYRPDSIAYQEAPSSEDSQGEQIEVDGVLVRYEEHFHVVRLTIEGKLPSATVEALRDDLKGKLEKITGQLHEVLQLLP